MQRTRSRIGLAAAATAAAALLVLATSAAASTSAIAGGARILHAVGAENEYANVIGQIGGRYVSVSAILSNPNTDPHTFEASPSVAQAVSAAQLVVQNGVGYDSFMNKIEAAAPSAGRRVIDVQTILGLPDSTANPHLWYSPQTMPAVAKAIAAELSSLLPGDARYFDAKLRRFDASLAPWYRAIAKLKAAYANVDVATTEPVADDLLQAAGIVNATPWVLQADIMNGVDPSPQGISFEQGLLAAHMVKAFVYNQQVTDSITQSFLAQARASSVPVVGVYETMPTPGYDYQNWMLAETDALYAAFAHRQSTTSLG